MRSAATQTTSCARVVGTPRCSCSFSNRETSAGRGAVPDNFWFGTSQTCTATPRNQTELTVAALCSSCRVGERAWRQPGDPHPLHGTMHRCWLQCVRSIASWSWHGVAGGQRSRHIIGGVERAGEVPVSLWSLNSDRRRRAICDLVAVASGSGLVVHVTGRCPQPCPCARILACLVRPISARILRARAAQSLPVS
jgi:hypothetical protein